MTADFTAECQSGPVDPARRERLLAAPLDVIGLECRALLTDLIKEINAFEPSPTGDASYAALVERVYEEYRAVTDPRAGPLAGYLGLVVMTAALLQRRMGDERGAQLKPAAHTALDDLCAALTKNPHVQKAIHEVYRPEPTADANAIAKWDLLKVETLTYRRAGTTSMILEARARETAWPIAVKCLLLPWSTIQPITDATRSYSSTYGTNASISDVVVSAFASSSTWVLMPFYALENLSEHIDGLHRPRDPKTGELDTSRLPTFTRTLEETRRVCVGLLDALSQLASGPNSNPEAPVVDGSDETRQHLDLSPNNVLVEPRADGTYRMHFIDLGRNHLYTRQIGLAEHDDSVFVAPEVKNRTYHGTSDVYSLGLSLISCLTGDTPRYSYTPDEVWQLSADLGRTIDDLIDKEPARRAMLLPAAPPPPVPVPPAPAPPTPNSQQARFDYTALTSALTSAFDRAALEPRDGVRGEIARGLPNSLAPTTLLKKAAEGDHLRHASYLAVASRVASVAYWLALATCGWLSLGDLLKGNFHTDEGSDKISAYLIALSQSAVAAKYYQSILATLTARGVPLTSARITEVAMRLTAVVAVPTVVVITWVDVDAWPWTCAAGAVAVALTNLLVLQTARRCLDAGLNRFSTVVVQQGFVGGFGQWWSSMFLYGVVLFIIAIGLSTGRLHDRGAYVVGLLLISFGIHYVTKCVIGGPAVKAGLARAFGVAERLVIAEQRGVLDGKDPWVVTKS